MFGESLYIILYFRLTIYYNLHNIYIYMWIKLVIEVRFKLLSTTRLVKLKFTYTVSNFVK